MELSSLGDGVQVKDLFAEEPGTGQKKLKNKDLCTNKMKLITSVITGDASSDITEEMTAGKLAEKLVEALGQQPPKEGIACIIKGLGKNNTSN